ncbi:class I adenylate-forming enzyme family protein [Pseudomonas sp. TH10]|uniref:class I adenylate-forming enzyme family protein n=1 Tax=Pseudomonas sp. TH10 TaxID=2796376 RepID=UPI0019136984|nr:AMP-binding protein [Pseudomonas sp. TH10]MBK5517920.1 AMP-binding protein [Pseudomonas sp. TH10]
MSIPIPSNQTLILPPGFRNMTVSSGIRSSAMRNPNKAALVCKERTRSYAQLIESFNQVANGVKGLGLCAGENAAIIAYNCLEYIEIVVGVSDMGAAVATPNPKLTAQELADICNDAQARIVFVHPECVASIDRALFETVEYVIVIGEQYDAFKAKASSQFQPPWIAEWSTYSIPYTSGTTGKPKGVMLPHRSRSMGCLAYAAEYGIYSPDDYFLAFAPLCHGAGLTYAIAAIFVGGTTEIVEKFEAEEILRAVNSGRVTGMFTVPTHYHAIFSLEDSILQANRTNRLNGIIANAAPLSQTTKEQIVEYFGEGLLHETYGSTEAGIVTNLRPQDQLRKVNCVGQPFVGNSIKLLDEQGREVGPGEVGELFSISPFMFSGYWGKEQATEEAFRDGWVGVGDMAMRDEEGYLYIVDRKKDMVISGGVNLYPREIEQVLDTHPAVLESAIIGVPDAQWGELLIACVVFELGAHASSEQLELFCRSQLASYKLPKRFCSISELPRNANGKVLKTTLRQWYAKGGAIACG